MSDVAIRVEDLSKRFQIGELVSARHLRRKVASVLRMPRRWLSRADSVHEAEEANTLWALKNVNFEVKRGQVLGIIGANGSGKSTLLKILSRITAPTSGKATVQGRIGSLLEVGTGFHPDLTGRENVYLNGSILGMRKKEIDRKFDEIVEFAGVDRFIDTPVKRYSSGMRVRLGFAVAAHLEPDILIVDEVLAVGDAEFQQRCIGKMDDISHVGRTVLFVSHNMLILRALCPRALVLSHGEVRALGDSEVVIPEYLRQYATSTDMQRDLTNDVPDRTGNGLVRFSRIELCSPTGQPLSHVDMGADLVTRLTAKASQSVRDVVFGVAIWDSLGTRLGGCNSHDNALLTVDFDHNQTVTVDCRIRRMNLMPGKYRVGIQCKHSLMQENYDYVPHAASFEVIPADVYGTGYTPRGQGIIYFDPEWVRVDA